MKGTNLFYLVLITFSFFYLYSSLNSTLVSASHATCLTIDCDFSRCIRDTGIHCTQWPSCSNPDNEIVRCGHEPVTEICSCRQSCGAECVIDSHCPEDECVDADGDGNVDDLRRYSCDSNSCDCSASDFIGSSVCRLADGECGLNSNECLTGISEPLPANSTHERWYCNGTNGGDNVFCSIPIDDDEDDGDEGSGDCTVGSLSDPSGTCMTADCYEGVRRKICFDDGWSTRYYCHKTPDNTYMCPDSQDCIFGQTTVYPGGGNVVATVQPGTCTECLYDSTCSAKCGSRSGVCIERKCECGYWGDRCEIANCKYGTWWHLRNGTSICYTSKKPFYSNKCGYGCSIGKYCINKQNPNVSVIYRNTQYWRGLPFPKTWEDYAYDGTCVQCFRDRDCSTGCFGNIYVCENNRCVKERCDYDGEIETRSCIAPGCYLGTMSRRCRSFNYWTSWSSCTPVEYQCNATMPACYDGNCVECTSTNDSLCVTWGGKCLNNYTCERRGRLQGVVSNDAGEGLENVKVSVVGEGLSDITNSNGVYSINGVFEGEYSVIAIDAADGFYESGVRDGFKVKAFVNNNLNFNLDLAVHGCRDDCTNADGWCSVGCEGRGLCRFNPATKDVCHGAIPGLVDDPNSNKQVLCCTGNFFTPTKATVEFCEGLQNVATVRKTVLFKSKLVDMVFLVFDSAECKRE